jgi:hypothetical protein
VAGKASLKIRFPLSKIGWHVQITLCYSDDFQQRFLVSAMPAPATAKARPSPDAGRWRRDGTAERDGAERTYYRRVRAMLAAVPAGDQLSLRP